MTNSGPQLGVNGALEMSPNISYQPLSTARFASLTLPLYMNGNSFKLVKSSPRSVLYLLSRQDIGTSIAPLGIALIDSILLVFTRPNRDTIIFAYQLAFM